jgi:hypothetical protein
VGSRIGILLEFHFNMALDNCSETVLGSFLQGVKQYGLPSRVRSDRGGENYQVARFMLLNRGVNRDSPLTGLSVYNHRIEHWWEDVWHASVSVYYNFFLCFVAVSGKGCASEFRRCMGLVLLLPAGVH